MIKIEKLNPFGRMCISLGMLPSSYKESLTYEEQLLWFMDFLENNVIPTVNNNADAVIELQNYVSQYFDNLDVQEEINNKLDEMALSGELEEIMADYLNSKAVFGFDTVADMKAATNLIDGSYARTYGYNTINDGGNAFYKIREITNEDVVDEQFIISLNDESLIAELNIIDNKVNILSLGAKNDGSTDTSSIIQNALSKIKTIYFPRGNYKVDDTIELSNSCNLIGENMSLSMLFTTADKPIIDITSKYFCTIKNLHLRGDNDYDNQSVPKNSKTSQNLLKIIGSNDCYFNNIYVDNAQANGIYIQRSDSQTAIQINFENIYVKNNSANGMYIGDVHGIKIDKGNCEYNCQSNIKIDGLPSDVNISNLNFNFNNKSKKSPLIINANNVVSNIKIDGLHIEDMSQETPASHDSTCCLDITSGMLDIGNLYVRYNPSHFTDCVKINNLSHVTIHDSIFRQVNNPITMPTNTGCMIRNIRTFDTTGSRVSGRGANYEDNFVLKNTSTIIGSDGNVSQYVIGGVHLPRTYNSIYSAQLFTPMGVAPTGNIYLTVFNSSYSQLAYETISLADFSNKKYDITSMLTALSDVRAIKIVMPQSVAANNVSIGITIDTI